MSDTNKKLNVALFIDADNTSSRHIDLIMQKAETLGNLCIRRAFGDFTNPKLEPWCKLLPTHAIQSVQHLPLIKAKNAADMAMTIDAVETLLTRKIDVFCIVSSDCDFTPLVLRLRAEGKYVVVFGNQKAPEPFTHAASAFVLLKNHETKNANTKPSSATQAPKPATPAAQKTHVELMADQRLLAALKSSVAECKDPSGWAPLALVGSQLGSKQNIRPSHYGYAKFSTLLKALGLYDMQKKKDGVCIKYKETA